MAYFNCFTVWVIPCQPSVVGIPVLAADFFVSNQVNHLLPNQGVPSKATRAWGSFP